MRTGRDFKVKIRFSDINPLAAVGGVVKQPTNLLVLIYSGFLFASQYCITYTASRTFAAAPYSYTPIKVGLVLLSFGTGNVVSVPLHYRSLKLVRLTRAHKGRLGRRRPLLRLHPPQDEGEE